MDLWQLNNGANQTWDFVPLANGSDVIVNLASGLVLDDPAFSNSANTQIDQWQLNGGPNQWWNMVSLPDGNVEIVNAYSGQALTDYNYSINAGTPVVQWPSYGGASQEWELIGGGPLQFGSSTSNGSQVDLGRGKGSGPLVRAEVTGLTHLSRMTHLSGNDLQARPYSPGASLPYGAGRT
jgi:hypothetical protein